MDRINFAATPRTQINGETLWFPVIELIGTNDLTIGSFEADFGFRSTLEAREFMISFVEGLKHMLRNRRLKDPNEASLEGVH